MKNKILIFFSIEVLLITSLLVKETKSLSRNNMFLKQWSTTALLIAPSSTINDDGTSSSDSSELNRRTLFSKVRNYGSSTLPFLFSTKQPVSAAVKTQLKQQTSTSTRPLIDVPMRRLKLPGGALGRDYVIIELMVKDKGPFDFMVDSGLSIEMITPHLQNLLGISRGDESIRGISATGRKTTDEALIELKGAKLTNDFSLPTLHAVVTNFPQEHLDPSHDPIEGMLGMEMLTLFDVDFDFPNNRLRLWEPGTVDNDSNNLVQVPAAVLNELGLLGIRITSPNQENVQPILGIIDCGASFSTINWKAASLLNLPTDTKAYRNQPTVMGISVDGKPFPLPTTKAQFTFNGNPQLSNDKKRMIFDKPPESWKPWDTVQVGIGDLPVFDDLLGDGGKNKSMKDFPIALIGLDILSQRRVILETSGSNTRSRRIFVSPS